MAINTQKFLPSSKGGALAKVNKTVIKASSSVILSENAVKNIGIIKVKVIEIDSILKGTLAAEKKKLNESKKQDSSKRREKIEEKLETKPKAETGKIKMPSLPRMGFLDWIKNFIGNVILGYFAVRLVEHLPKIIPIVKFLGKATDLVLGLGGKLLNGLVTFIDWGYKAVDFSRNLIGKTFGDDALKNFDKLTNEFEKFMNLAIIVGMAGADFGMSRLRDRGTKRGAEKVAGTVGRRGAGRVATRAAARVGGKGAAKLTAKVGSKALKAIPFLGAGLAIVEGIMRIREGDYVGGLLSFGSAIPIAGWVFLALDVAREFMGGKEFDKSVGRAFSGKPGVTDNQIKKRSPYMSGPSIVTGLAEGGITRGGKSAGKVKRTVSRSTKGKYKRRVKITPKKPGDVKATSPGADVGGEQKLFGLFPNPFKMAQKASDVMNPFKVIQKAGQNLGESDYFGPILAITSKILLGQKPTQQDYTNVGLGINMLVAKGIDDGKLKGGLAAAFVEGGLVDPKALDAISQGGDISDWVAKSFKEATETNAQKTLREIQENLKLKKVGGEETAPSPGDMGAGGGVQVSSDSPDFWLLATAAMFENSDPQGAADVAQAIYNRVAMPGDPWKVNNSIRKSILDPGQFQPVSDYASPSAWAAIKTKEDAIKFAKSQGKTQAQLETVAAAILDKSKQQSARQFVGPRDSFRSYAFENAENHLADETEVRRLGHAFGFEPRGATIGMFKAGKLSAAQVNAGIVGNVKFGASNFIQGNSGASDGVHFHVGTTKPGDPSGPAAAAFNVIKHFLGKKSVFIGRSEEFVPSNATDEQIRKIIARGQSAHRKTEIDIQVGGAYGQGNKVPFPLQIKNHRFEPGGYGMKADIVGVNAFVGHGRYTLDGKLAKQEGTVLSNKAPDSYYFGGKSFGISPRDGFILSLHKGEMFKVIDKDSVNLFGYDLTKEIIDIENKSQLVAKAPSIIEKLKLISGYASYETEAQETIVVTMPSQINGSSYETNETYGGVTYIGSSREESDPFSTLYQGG
jgi:hypothetical protein